MKRGGPVKGIRRLLLFICILCQIFWTAFPVGAQEIQKAQQVRVGYFHFDGYHMIDDRGRRSGYGYEYLQYMARYANFNYEYVGYEDSWNEMQDMLERGEIDLLTSAQKTEERMKRFDFSDQPVGNSAAIVTVRVGDKRYMTDDYSKLCGIRVGLLKGNSRNDSFEKFAEKHGFTYVPVYFEDSEALTRALKEDKTVDAILTSNLRRIRDEWVVATFDVTPFYVMVKKGDRELLDKVNRAISSVRTNYPNLEETLYARYYSAKNGDEIAYTAQERRYISRRYAKKDAVRVTLNMGREPVAYYADGEARGIIPEIARKVMDRTGLPYEFSGTDPMVDSRELLMNDEADVRFDGIADFNDAEKYGFRVTDPYLQLTLSYVTLQDFSGDLKKVAVIRNSDVVETYVEKLFDESAITRYDSVEECLNSVLRGEQDAAYFQTYIAQNLINHDVRNRLKEQLVPGYFMSFAVAVSQKDPVLFSILNKAVSSLDSEEVDHIIYEETTYLSRDESFLGYLYDHPLFLLISMAAAAVFVIVLILNSSKRKNLELERGKTREFERFITYVCRANDSVMEIDFTKQLIMFYQVEDGKVCCQERPLGPENRTLVKIHPEDRGRIEPMISEEELRSLPKRGGEIYFECRGLTPEDCWQWFSFTLQGVQQEESESRLMIFIKNIDRAKRDEAEKRQALQDALTAARAAGDAKGEFMSRMSHEIRTPLNAIIGYLTIAKSNLRNISKAGECLEKSEFAAHHLLNIINDVLDISAIESGKMKIAHEVFNIRQLLSGLLSMFRTQAREKGVGFHVRLIDLTEEELKGDQMRVSQILMNLLSNAVKFTPSGGQVSLTLTQKALADRKVYLQFEISDTGIGMSEEFRQRLFQPFEQQDASTAQRFGGTGLGLSITRNLVTMMGGMIDVETEEGTGTTFTVNLPLDRADSSGNGREGSYDFSGLRVLVLYDENSDYRGMQALLDRFGVACTLTLAMEEALKEIAGGRESGMEYDLCLLDWESLGRDGKRTAEKLRAAGTPQKPVLVAVAYEDPGCCGENGLIQCVVLKPVFQSSLFDVLSNACQLYSNSRISISGEEDFGLSGTRILLAEDNEMNMEIAKEILGTYGLLIDGACNGEEAVRLFEQSEEGTYRAILMDIQMPVMNGYEAARAIRSGGHPQANTIPIIALTADAFAEDVNHALAAGMNGHMAKPIDFPRLCRTLTQYV